MSGLPSADINAILHELEDASGGNADRYILTGERGAGKTLWCSRLGNATRELDLILGGVLSPGVYEKDQRVAINLQDLTTGGVRRLAVKRSGEGASHSTLNWSFDEETLSWGNQILSTLGEVDLLILDEIGPLELLHGNGLHTALQLIDRGRYRTAIIVVRPSLLEQASQRWPDARVLKLPR
ncbi:MAG: nucleoside-triphosphatase [Anaerolineales bacterium]|jgi:nucleoside-triphosphatase THEP1